jgi:hypothetical protein
MSFGTRLRNQYPEVRRVPDLLLRAIERPKPGSESCPPPSIRRCERELSPQRHGSARPEALPFGDGDLVTDTLADHLSFELGEGQKHIEGKPSHARCNVERTASRRGRRPHIRRTSRPAWRRQQAIDALRSPKATIFEAVVDPVSGRRNRVQPTDNCSTSATSSSVVICRQ